MENIFKENNAQILRRWLIDNVKFTDNSPGEPQPEVVRIGGAYKAMDGKNITIAAAIENCIYDKNASGLRLGSEYVFNKYCAIRGGFILENNGDLRPTIGFGVYEKGFGLDYSATIAPSSMSDMNVSRFSFSYKFSS